MSQKNLIMVGIILIVIIIFVAVISYFVLSSPSTGTPAVGIKSTVGQKAVVPPTLDQYQAQIKKDFPTVISGVINFLDATGALKTTVKTDDGKIYTLMPGQPKSVYESFGAKNGGRVEIQAKVLDNLQINWGAMKPI